MRKDHITRTYQLSRGGSVRLYEQLCRELKTDILSGALPAGTKLPAKRPFAAHLGVSVITVENAYDRLRAEGYIDAVAKKGFFVSTEIPASLPPVRRQAIPSPQTEATPRSTDRPSGRIDLSAGRVLPELFPFSVWAKLTRRVLAEREVDLLKPSPPRGVDALREAIALHLRAFRGIDASPAQIVVGAGTEYLYSLLTRLLGREHIYAVEDPGYRKLDRIYRADDVTCLPLPLDDKGMMTAPLDASGAHILHISPSHHFPTGRVTPIGRRYELLGWAASAPGRYVIEDDYDSELRLEGTPIPAMYGIDLSGRVIYMNTFSKTLSPTLRISYMVLPEALSARFDRELGFSSCTVGNLAQYTLAAFMNEGYFENHLNRLRRFYRQRHGEVLKALRDAGVLDQVEIMEERAGLHFLLRLPSAVQDGDLVRLAAESGLTVSCLSSYYADPARAVQGILVIDYSSLTQALIPEVAAKFAALLRKLQISAASLAHSANSQNR